MLTRETGYPVTANAPFYGQWIGTLDGFVNANVKAQVTGYLLRQDYKEGAFVKKGQLLFQIDPRPFQAALDQARAQLAQAKAQLINAEAVGVSPRFLIHDRDAKYGTEGPSSHSIPEE
jgi:multidrug efflux pump subunit AcrA (membrane-fusion protein)